MVFNAVFKGQQLKLQHDTGITETLNVHVDAYDQSCLVYSRKRLNS